MKPCNKCGVEKELTQFYLSNHRRDGRTNTCAECLRERDRIRRRTVEFQNLPCQRRKWAEMMMKHLRINACDY